jgi:hypothetical protein
MFSAAAATLALLILVTLIRERRLELQAVPS